MPNDSQENKSDTKMHFSSWLSSLENLTPLSAEGVDSFPNPSPPHSSSSSPALKARSKSPHLTLITRLADHTTRKSSFMLSWPDQRTVTSLWPPPPFFFWEAAQDERLAGVQAGGGGSAALEFLLYGRVKDEWVLNESKMNDSLRE